MQRTEMPVQRIGFLGLGPKGKAMASRLARAQRKICVFDKNISTVRDLLDLGASACDSPAETARDKDLIILMLPEGDQETLFGARGLIHGLKKGAIVADMGSHSLTTRAELAKAVKECGAHFLEAPVWGTAESAENGTLTVLAGGERATLGRCHEAFEAFALNIMHVGKHGDATRMLYLVGMVQAAMTETLAEAMTFGTKVGFSPEQVLKVLTSGYTSSPLFREKGRSICKNDFTPCLSLKYVHGQLDVINDIANRCKQPLPAATAIFEQYEKAMAQNMGDEDYSAVVKLLKQD